MNSAVPPPPPAPKPKEDSRLKLNDLELPDENANESEDMLASLADFLNSSDELDMSPMEAEEMLAKINLLNEQLDGEVEVEEEEEEREPSPLSSPIQSANNYNHSKSAVSAAKSPSNSSMKLLLHNASRMSVRQSPRPTPYQVWRQSHGPDSIPKETKKLSEGEWDNLVDRLNESGRRKKMTVLRAQHKQIADQFAELSFVPKICAKSRELAQNMEHLPDRLDNIMRLKREKQHKILQRRKQAELAPATFKPNTKVPCVCGRGKGLNESSPHELEKHTDFCLNFMNACTTLNKKCKMQTMSNNIKRSVNDLLEFAETKNRKAIQRRHIIEEVQQRDMTFSPQISRNSKKIYERMVREGRNLKKSSRALITGTYQDIGHEEEKFVPEINERSRFARRGDASNVYSRLYEHGMQHIQKRVDTDDSRLGKYVNTLDLPQPITEVHPDNFHSSRLVVREEKDPMAVTQVVYQPKEHNFILQRLGIME
eukprot:TRINITY_DN128125_c0_g3_i1.p1 TRINITY_DN128125_c0_g3~~TRINITY_DN128125_c0_g3_i1.p1  ORF type:complete len:483 (+),score=138.12 TRINITY_DN128125_c0_g3_i1:60-1508(+)